jgi:hypothetical protein
VEVATAIAGYEVVLETPDHVARMRKDRTLLPQVARIAYGTMHMAYQIIGHHVLQLAFVEPFGSWSYATNATSVSQSLCYLDFRSNAA